jgi:hypothetical protein
MRFVILHYHIFKNAGMSIEDILDRNFGERFCRLDGPDRNGRIVTAGLLSFLLGNSHMQAVSSHQFRYPMPRVPGFLFFDLCFLRDPLDRIRSMYDYSREKPAEGDPLSELAARHTLGGFVEQVLSRLPHQACNAQTSFLDGDDVPARDLGDDHLKRATRTMLQTSFLGVVDRFEQSLAAGEFFLRPVFAGLRCATSAVNVSGGTLNCGTLDQRKRRLQEACGEKLYAALVSGNALDLELLNRARAEVERRFKQTSA